MKAVVIRSHKPPVLEWGDAPGPVAGNGEVLVRIHASALNRADLLQARGLYPPPAGESEVPGLECAGEIETVGAGVEGWQPGDRVMALLAGGGQAERVAIPTGQLMPIPDGLDYEQAAALPEVALTSWTNLVHEGGLEPGAEGQTVLITAAASGVGTFAVQLARELDARVLVAGRSLERLERLRELGADACVELGAGLPAAVRDLTDGEGVGLVIDLAGGEGVAHALTALRRQGRLVLVGVLAGGRAEIDLADVLRRRLQLVGSVLRARSREEKKSLVEAFSQFANERLNDGRLKPIVDRVIPAPEVAEAYAQMAAGGVWGKIVLRMNEFVR